MECRPAPRRARRGGPRARRRARPPAVEPDRRSPSPSRAAELRTPPATRPPPPGGRGPAPAPRRGGGGCPRCSSLPPRIQELDVRMPPGVHLVDDGVAAHETETEVAALRPVHTPQHGTG